MSDNKTEIIEVQGKGRWFHVLQRNKFGDWSLELFPNKDSLEVIRKLQAQGMRNQLKWDDTEDAWFVRFKRPPKKEIRGVMVEMEPPVVMDQNGVKLSGDISFGNGSDVTLALEVYEHGTPSGKKAKAARLRGVKFDNLIPFNRETDYPKEEQPVAEKLYNTPKQEEDYWS
jgi:hypothetical protein